MTKLKQKAFWIAFGDVGGRGLAFITSIYLARILGADYYGLITVAVAILGYANWLADLGLINIGVREIAKIPENREFRAKEIFNLKIALFAFTLIGFASIIYFIPMGSLQKQIILGYLCSLIPYSLLLEWYYHGRQEFGKAAISKIVNSAVYLGLVFWIVKGIDEVVMVPILYTFGITSAVVVLATFALIDKPFPLPARSFNIYKRLFKRSSLVGLGGFFATVVQLLPPILIGIFLDIRQAGIYGAALKIIIVAMMLDRVFVNLLLPNLASLWSSNKKGAIEKVNTVLRLLTVGGAAITLLTALNSDQIIGLLFGAEYAESGVILKILSIFIFLTFLNSLFSFGLLATGKDSKYFMATSIGGTISAIIIFVGASIGTIEIVAYSVVASELVICASSYFWFKKVIPLKLLKIISIVSITSVSIFMMLQYLELHHLISSLIALITVCLVSWYTKVIRIGDINWTKQKLMP